MKMTPRPTVSISFVCFAVFTEKKAGYMFGYVVI